MTERLMSRDNKLVSGDNMGAAARFFGDWFNLISNKSVSTATGGQPCGKTASQGFKVRKSDGSRFVGAFCQPNVGDVIPNVLGAFFTDTGKPCDFNHSSCSGNDQLCVGRDPGYLDEIWSTKIIGEKQFQKGCGAFHDQLSGKID
ncbi:Neutral/alkaline nonlysosomal ceramidase [Corchorus olitorius]|uniref:Neutral/alkaline nonlysosomal ceramidase n=1 Tax=Corchorus olitorius TaxID=93759 RepID=A0A1R3KPZ3_9ROSI|nr:Neutral/alkaline nonlysosomal ceramidase [Corchorus olitorius]